MQCTCGPSSVLIRALADVLLAPSLNPGAIVAAVDVLNSAGAISGECGCSIVRVSKQPGHRQDSGEAPRFVGPP